MFVAVPGTMAYVLDMEESGLIVPEGLEAPSRSVQVQDEAGGLTVQLDNPGFRDLVVVEDQENSRFFDLGSEWETVDEASCSEAEDVQPEGLRPFSVTIQGRAQPEAPGAASVVAVSPTNADVSEEAELVAADSGPTDDRVDDSNPSKKRRRSVRCGICDKEVLAGKALCRHVEQQHLPYYFNPATACWSCELSVSSLAFLHQHRLECDAVFGEGAFQSDDILHRWVLWSTGCLHFLRTAKHLQSLEQLRIYVSKHHVSPSDCEFSPSRDVLLNFVDRHLGQNVPATHTVSPPNTIAAILHWRTVMSLVQSLPPADQERFRDLQSPASLQGPVESTFAPLWPATFGVFDSHAHLEKTVANHDCTGFPALKTKVSDGRKVTGIVSNFVFPKDWNKYTKFEDVNQVYFTFSVHPRAASEDWDRERLQWLLQHPRTVAIGEMGLTLPLGNSDDQFALLARLLPMARRTGLPVVVHCQGPSTYDQMLVLLKKHLWKYHKIQLHSFEGDSATVNSYVAAFPNTVFSIGGLIFHANADKLLVIRGIELHRIVLETDSPFLAPPGTPHHRNHPWNVHRIAREVGRLKNLPTRVVAEAAQRNAEWFFGL